MPGINKILCPLDLSGHSATVLQLTAKLAEALQSQVVVLYVAPEFTEFANCYVSPVPAVKPAGPRGKGRSKGRHEVLIDDAREAMEKLMADNLAGINAVPLISKGAIAEEILRAARDQEVDLIIMGTQGRTGLERLLLGSVAEQIIKTAPVPVMTIRPQTS